MKTLSDNKTLFPNPVRMNESMKKVDDNAAFNKNWKKFEKSVCLHPDKGEQSKLRQFRTFQKMHEKFKTSLAWIYVISIT